MAAKSLQELFVEELRDMYDAEKRLIRALPKMAKAAGNDDLREAFTSHLEETRGQVERLEEVFDTIGERPRGKKCDGMMGIIEESSTALEELDGPVLDAALIAGAQKAEHYEIASYGTLAYFAELLGNERAKTLLGETLDEEKAADEKLNMLATSQVNRDALMGNGSGEDDEDEPATPRQRAGAAGGSRTASRSTASRGKATASRGKTKASGRRGR